MSERDDDYQVGYGKPPKGTRFKPGQSGNRSGRPKGSRNLKTDLLDEFAEEIVVRESGQARTMSKQRALLKGMMAKGLNGNDRVAVKLLDLYVRLTGLEAEADEAGIPLSDDEQAILRTLEERILRKARLTPDHPATPDTAGAPGSTNKDSEVQ